MLTQHAVFVSKAAYMGLRRRTCVKIQQVFVLRRLFKIPVTVASLKSKLGEQRLSVLTSGPARRELHPSPDIAAGLKSRQKFMKFDHGERRPNPLPCRRYGFLGRKNTRLTFQAPVFCSSGLRFDLGTKSRAEKRVRRVGRSKEGEAKE